jgi:hypothetical protein
VLRRRRFRYGESEVRSKNVDLAAVWKALKLQILRYAQDDKAYVAGLENGHERLSFKMHG